LIIWWDISGKKRDIAIAETSRTIGQGGDQDLILANIEKEKDIIIMNVIKNMEEGMNVIIEGILALARRNAAMMKR
jgi:hypothetical protein